jgi:hypothetical protein
MTEQLAERHRNDQHNRSEMERLPLRPESLTAVLRHCQFVQDAVAY